MDYTETESLIAVFQIVAATCINEQIKIDTEDSFLIYVEKHRKGIYILLDQCRYTQTMCVQEYLKTLRNGDAKDDTLKKEAENTVLNLKMRKEAIDLEKIPPKCFCLHAVT